jgi:hypothetical protein
MWANSSKNNKCRELAKVTTAVTIVVVVTLFELMPMKSIWIIPVREEKEHVIAVSPHHNMPDQILLN